MFGRRVLTSCWEAILDVLSVLTSGRSCCGISSSLAVAVLFSAREENRRVRQAICTSLTGLQKAARLSSILGEFSSKQHSFNGPLSGTHTSSLNSHAICDHIVLPVTRHTHTPIHFTALWTLTRITHVSQYQKGKTSQQLLYKCPSKY